LDALDKVVSGAHVSGGRHHESMSWVSQP